MLAARDLAHVRTAETWFALAPSFEYPEHNNFGVDLSGKRHQICSIRRPPSLVSDLLPSATSFALSTKGTGWRCRTAARHNGYIDLKSIAVLLTFPTSYDAGASSGRHGVRRQRRRHTVWIRSNAWTGAVSIRQSRTCRARWFRCTCAASIASGKYSAIWMIAFVFNDALFFRPGTVRCWQPSVDCFKTVPSATDTNPVCATSGYPEAA